jgi:Tol biopolymer transport system component
MDELDARLVAGTDKDSLGPFFSPDGQWIGYYSLTEAKLKKVAISGGAPVTICETGPLVLGASWSSDNTILYSDILKGVMRVSADGGTPDVLIKGSLVADPDKEGFPVVPQMLPDGKTLLFTNVIGLDPSNWQVGIQSLKSGERKTLIRSGAGAFYCPTGHLVYELVGNNATNLMAIPFDLDRLDVKGGSVPMLEGIAGAAVSDSGTLVYIPRPRTSPAAMSDSTAATTASGGSTLVWVDRQGKEEPLGADPKAYTAFSISPDATRVAVTVGTGIKSDIWIWDINRKTMTRLTFDEGNNNFPLWTPDSQRIVYASRPREGGLGSICSKAADGSGGITKLGSASDRALIPSSLSKDGKTLALIEVTLAPLGTDIGMMSMEGDHAIKPLLQGKYNELNPKISPDGRWLAYSSNESGKEEVYVRPFPDVESGGRWQISTNGGDSPLWSPDGNELFYRQGDSIMSVAVETAPIFKPGNPKFLFKGTNISSNDPTAERTTWDIHPNGKKFLMLKPPGSSSTTSAEPGPRKIIVVTNWFEELKQKVPVK